MTLILGISAFYHDSSATLIENGEIKVAVQEERFTRIKNDAQFPTNSIKYILSFSKIQLSEIDYIVFYEKPFLKFERILETFVAEAPKGFNLFRKFMPIWLREKLFQKNEIVKNLKNFDKNFKSQKILFAEHHLSHASSAFFPSPFDEAIILTLDGAGEWATTTVAIGKKNKIQLLKEIHFPHSIGLLYSAFTYYLGFKVNSGEYKVMGLAPYGEPKYTELIEKNLINIKEDGSFRLNLSFFNYTTGLTMTNDKFTKLFKRKVRDPNKDQLTQFHFDIAASIQKIIEKVIIKITNHLSNEYKIKNLCLAGGVALNCVSNSKILKKGKFNKIWIQPAAGDAGGSLGSALLAWYHELHNNRIVNKKTEMKHTYYGPEFSDHEIGEALKQHKANYHLLDVDDLLSKTADAIIDKKAIGWFQGRMEYGPRALGSRSIIADPRDPKMQKKLNLKVKFRESFRPFAPAVLKEYCNEFFDINTESPFMLFTADVKKGLRVKETKYDKNFNGVERLNIKRSIVPAITHVDYSARIQTVDKETNPKFHALISKFNNKTNCPLVINTSFNVRGEPIVHNPDDAYKCFMKTNLDVLVIGNYFLLKEEQ